MIKETITYTEEEVKALLVKAVYDFAHPGAMKYFHSKWWPAKKKRNDDKLQVREETRGDS